MPARIQLSQTASHSFGANLVNGMSAAQVQNFLSQIMGSVGTTNDPV